jgi:prenyltransferase beta subunit
MTMRTCSALLVSIWLIGPVAAQPAKTQDQETISFVQALRNPDGGYAPAPDRPGTPVRSSLRATTAAIRAMKYLGGEVKDATGTASFVERCYDKATGGFGDYPGEPPSVGTTAVAVMAIAELKAPLEPFRDGAVKYLDERPKTIEDLRIAAAAFEARQARPPKADAWLKQAAANRNPDGTFGTGQGIARATGGTAVLILRLGGTIENREAVLKALRTGQRPDGGFGSSDRDGSDLESTYRVMRAFVMLKERPAQSEKLEAFVAKCRAAAGGYGPMPGQPPTAGATYYAAIVSHWLATAQVR